MADKGPCYLHSFCPYAVIVFCIIDEFKVFHRRYLICARVYCNMKTIGETKLKFKRVLKLLAVH